MRVLLDTHVALWAIVDSPRLTSEVRSLIADEANTIFVSVASLWEITIKFSLARGHPSDMPLSAQQAFDYFLGAGMRILDISSEHVLAVASLAPNHADPFDRILVAQSLSEPLRLVTHDPQVAAYSDAIILF